MKRIDTLSHSKWVCKYHGVFIPKYRHKALYKELRRHLGDVFRSLADQYECRIEEGHLMPDHVHILLSIPPKYVVSDVVGFPKGKSAIHIARTYVGRRRNFTGQHFWAWGYDVSTVGRAEATIRAYIQRQEGAVNTLLKFPFSTLANGQRLQARHHPGGEYANLVWGDVGR